MSEEIIITDIPKETDNKEFIDYKDLDGKKNLVFAIVIKPDTKELVFVIGNQPKYIHTQAYFDLMDWIKFHWQQMELRKRAASVQAVPESVLEKLRG